MKMQLRHWSLRLLLYLLGFLLLMQLIHLSGCRTVAPKPCPTQPTIPAGSTFKPVVFVHGINTNGCYEFGKMREHLIKKGAPRCRLFLAEYPDENAPVCQQPTNDGRVCLEDAAAVVGRRIQAALRLTKYRKKSINIVAMSMGNLVTRYWLQRMGGAQYVDTYVAISGPQWGSEMADALGFLCRCAYQQMRPASSFLKDLNKDRAALFYKYKIKTYTIHTKYDLIVLPSRSACFGTAMNLQVNATLHDQVPKHPDTLKIVTHLLMNTAHDDSGVLSAYRVKGENASSCPFQTQPPSK